MENKTKELLLHKHIKFIATYGKTHDVYEYECSDYLRMSGLYWSITFLDLTNSIESLNREEIKGFVKRNQHENGGFGPSDGHEPHLLYTLSALQIVVIYDFLDEINKEKLIEFIVNLQQQDGSFSGDKWGEIDTRFSFCAVAALSLLNALDRIDQEKAILFVLKCLNFDGGFGRLSFIFNLILRLHITSLFLKDVSRELNRMLDKYIVVLAFYQL